MINKYHINLIIKKNLCQAVIVSNDTEAGCREVITSSNKLCCNPGYEEGEVMEGTGDVDTGNTADGDVLNVDAVS